MRDRDRAGRLTALLVAVAAFVLTLFLFTPARIYIGNFKEFTYLLRQSAIFFLALSLGLTILLFIPMALRIRRPTTHRLVVSLLTVAAFLLWFQGNILLWQYGVLNGRAIEWEGLVRYGLIDSTVWVACLVFAVLRADLVVRVSRFTCLVLVAIQLVSVSLAWIAMPKDQAFRQQGGAKDSLFLFSRHVNVIVIVLDTFQSDIFQDIMEDDPELRSSFDGFTYFRNALTSSDGTSASIPNILTGSMYDNSEPYLEYVKRSFLENSLPKTLDQYGFSIDMYPILPYSVYDDFSEARLPRKRLMEWGSFIKEQAFIADLALFRTLPHFAKRVIYNGQAWFLSGFVGWLQDVIGPVDAADAGGAVAQKPYDLKYAREYANTRDLVRRNWDATFINKMIPQSGILPDRDAFKFYHLNGVHLQLVLNEDLRWEPQDPTREAIMRQGTGVLKIAAILLERLRQVGAYDDSLIFIVGDHGSGLTAANIRPSPLAARFNRTGVYKGLFRSFKTAGIPLILAKRIGARGELRTSDAPVELGDIPQTVAEELGLQARFPGRAMFSVKEGEDRERIYRAFFGPQENVKYLAPLYEYAVRGFSWDDASWRETGKVYTAASR